MIQIPRGYRVITPHPGYDFSLDKWIVGVPWHLTAQLSGISFPVAAEFDEAIVSVSVYYSTPKNTIGDVVLDYAFIPDGDSDRAISWHSIAHPALSLDDCEPDILYRLSLGAFPLKRGDGGLYVVGRDMKNVNDTAADTEAIRLWALEFVFNECEEAG